MFAQPTSIAYIDFEKVEDAEKAQKEMNNSPVDDKIIQVDFYDKQYQQLNLAGMPAEIVNNENMQILMIKKMSKAVSRYRQ